MQKKKDGEKALLLHACGEYLFGCTGTTLVTQGIYSPEKREEGKCFCKRAVWIPSQKSMATLKERFASFGIPFPSRLETCPVVGLCGKNPTRTAHAIDSTFLVVSAATSKRYVVSAIASFDHSQLDEYTKPLVSLNTISADPADIDRCVEWIENEFKNHEKEKIKKRPRDKRTALVPVDGHFCDGEGSECVTFVTRYGDRRVFAEPRVLSCLKRRRTDNVSFMRPVVYERVYIHPGVGPMFSQGEPLFFPSSSSGSSSVPFLAIRSGMEGDSVSSPEHVITTPAGAPNSNTTSDISAAYSCMDSSSCVEDQNPVSPLDIYPFYQPTEEEGFFRPGL